MVFITGLSAEARLLRALPATTHVGGAAAAAAIAAGAKALVSFGLAGGLDPALPPGAILRPERVVWRDRIFQADPALVEALGGVTCGAMLAADVPIASAREKKMAFERSGAAGVDMESGAVAEAAARRGVPFAVLRAVCDVAAEEVPPAALLALDSAGKIGILRVAHSVVRQPSQVPALLALARHAGAARAALAQEIARITARGALTPWL
jgi:adenosylhomocysteine nucleosidase